MDNCENLLKEKDEEIRRLNNIIALKDEDIEEMESSLARSMQTIQTFYQQQKSLYEEFVVLRSKYDDLKDSLVELLWVHCAKHHPELKNVFPYVESEDFLETETRIGIYSIGSVLGEGQFGQVFTCKRDGKDTELAVKILVKDSIVSFTALKRLANEIDILRHLDSENIISVEDVILTQTKLYMITQKGGPDLFEFFDENPNGVSETWAKEIASNIIKAVSYCHERGVCHRDLKPENVLMVFNRDTVRCEDLKLCDFGLSSKFLPRMSLQEFCGSPGFFAPEMLISSAYYGDRADIWSVGCILLELMLGHEKFCEFWMSNAFDYEVMQDKDRFETEIKKTVASLPTVLTFSPDCNDFISKFLKLRASERWKCDAVKIHPWIKEKFPDDGGAFSRRSARLHIDTSAAGSGSGSALNGDPAAASTTPTPMPKRENSRVPPPEISTRQRKRLEDYNRSMSSVSVVMDAVNEDGAGQAATLGQGANVRLPPIEPKTPGLGRAKQLLQNGEKLASEVSVSLSRERSRSRHVSQNSSAYNSPDDRVMYSAAQQARRKTSELLEYSERSDCGSVSSRVRLQTDPS